MKKVLLILAFGLTFLVKGQKVEAKTTRVTVGVGEVTIKEGYGTDYIKIICNNGLVIEADWEADSNISGFGYDIIDVEVSESYNKMAVFMTLRSVIVAYLRGDYN